MNWHEPTQEEIDGKGKYRYIVDIIPDGVPHQATTDGDALIRITRPGWSWGILDLTDKANLVEMGYEDTREAAIGTAFAALAKLREETDAASNRQGG